MRKADFSRRGRTDDLTRDCLLEKAKVSTWTGGGLHAETGPADSKMSQCFLFIRVDPKAFVYDKKMTDPNEELYNCDPKNVGKVKPVED